MKGITEIVATILLVLITISLVGMASLFFNRTQSAAAQVGEERLEETLAQIGTSFKIDYADKNKVFIRNLGNIQLKNMDVYVNNVRMKIAPIIIAPKEIGEIVLDDSQLSMMSDPAELKVVVANTEVKSIVSFYEHYTVGHWKFDEGSGNTAKDSSIKNNEGRISGAQWVDGKIKKALNFDGMDDFVNVTDSLELKSYSTTVQAWFKFNSLTGTNKGGSPTGQQFIIFKKNSHSENFSDYSISKHSTNQLIFELANITGYQIVVNAGNVEIGTWYHFVATFDNKTKKMSIYLNGRLKDSKIEPNFVMDHSDTNIYFGRTGQNFDAFFNGALDDVRILRIARSMQTV